MALTFRRYYRLLDAAPRGLSDPHTRSDTISLMALREAVQLASQLKDLQHPQEQDWLRSLFTEAARERWEYLLPASGLRSHLPDAPQRHVRYDEALSELSPTEVRLSPCSRRRGFRRSPLCIQVTLES